MKKKYDVVATVGEYKTKDGATKKRYLTVGTVFEGEKGLSMKLEALPLSKEWSGWLSLYEPRDNNQQQPKPSGYQPKSEADGDDIPF